MLFVVFKHGVYRHGCGGVFSSFDLASAAGRGLIVGEKDDHHQYEVIPFELDEMTKQTKGNGWGGEEPYEEKGLLLERPPVLVLERKDGETIEVTSRCGLDPN